MKIVLSALIAVIAILGWSPTNGQVPPPAAASAAPTASSAFAEALKGAKSTPGLLTVHEKADRILLEIPASALEQDFLLSPTVEGAIGDQFNLAGDYLDVDQIVIRFRKVGRTVHLLRRNLRYQAASGSAMQSVLERSFADSIIASAKLEVEPHPESRSLLVDAGALFSGDLLLYGYRLEKSYRLPYKVDAATSAVTGVRPFPANVEITASLNFTIDRQPVPAPGAAPMPTPPIAPPDLRSLVVRMRYSVSTLPGPGFRPRLADDRIGYFTEDLEDFTDQRTASPYVRFIHRWRLEKSDPAATLSPPRQPIVIWIEKTVPERYRPPIREGILRWNEALEKIGLKDAIVVKDQPPEATWDPADSRYNTVRWFAGRGSGFLEAPSRVDPRTGEIYDFDIRVGDEFVRSLYGGVRQFLAPITGSGRGSRPGARCTYSQEAAARSEVGRLLLEARGVLGTPEAVEAFVDARLSDLLAHEVGHALGLRHNFRGSTAFSMEEVFAVSPGEKKALTASVMDYNLINVVPRGRPQGPFISNTLGSYDFLAIEYGYRMLPASTPEERVAERAELARIAARTREPGLGYATDEDVAYSVDDGPDVPFGIDPRAARWDAGTDATSMVEHWRAHVKELLSQLERGSGKPGATWQSFLQSFEAALEVTDFHASLTARWVGALKHNREHVGDVPGLLPYEPVARAEQRKALDFIVASVFAKDALPLSPQLLNKLAVDRFSTWEDPDSQNHKRRLDFPLHERVLGMQRNALDLLLHPVRLSRLQDLERRNATAKEAFTLTELFVTLREGLWSELKDPVAEIGSFRRAAQREHLKRLVRMVLKPDPKAPEDAATLARADLAELNNLLRRARGPGLAKATPITRAHLAECAARVGGALSAQIQTGVE